MTRREGRAPAFPVIALAVCLALSGCTASEPESAVPEQVEEQVSVHWVEREVRVHTLDRMFHEGDSHEVITNMDGTRERLFDIGIVVEDEDDYTVELDKDAWNDEVNLNQVDGSLGNAMHHNEVIWCGEAVSGEDFVKAYMDEYGDSFGTQEEYTESVADYVDCGTGQP